MRTFASSRSTAQDRSLVHLRLAAIPRSKALIPHLVQLGKTLGIETLGEGIEARAKLRELQSERCDLGQGFLFARPLEASAIEELLERSPANSSVQA